MNNIITKKTKPKAWLLAGFVFAIASTAFSETTDSALGELLETLAELERQLQSSPLHSDPVRRAEATDYLLKSIAYHLHRDIISADPYNPRLMFNPAYGAPNVDTYYLSNTIDPNGVYRIYGELGTVNQTIFGVYSMEAFDGESGAASRIKGRELTLEKDGSFEIFVSREKMGTNWLYLPPTGGSMSIYQIFGDWNTERKGTILLERLDTNTQRAPIPSEEIMANKIAAFNAGIRKNVSVWLSIFEHLMQKKTNIFETPKIIQVASKGSYFSAATWDVKDDQALIIQFDEPPGSTYWSFSLYTVWSDVLDRASRHTSLNFTQTHRDEDGKYRIVMAARDPGIANWLDIEGHPQGVINWRVTTEKQPKAPIIKAVPLADLHKHLPKATKTITMEERDMNIAARKRHMQKRLSD